MPDPIRLQVVPPGTNTPQRPNSKKNQEKSDRGLRYPLKQMEKDTDYLQIDIKQYKATGLDIPENVNQLKNRLFVQNTASKNLRTTVPKQTIFLPIPQNIQDTNAVGWGEDSLNSIAAYGAGQVSDLIGSRAQEIPGKIGNIIGDLKGAGETDTLRTLANQFLHLKQ